MGACRSVGGLPGHCGVWSSIPGPHGLMPGAPPPVVMSTDVPGVTQCPLGGETAPCGDPLLWHAPHGQEWQGPSTWR